MDFFLLNCQKIKKTLVGKNTFDNNVPTSKKNRITDREISIKICVRETFEAAVRITIQSIIHNQGYLMR